MNTETLVTPKPVLHKAVNLTAAINRVSLLLWERRKIIFLSIILVVALLFRLWHINQPYVDLISWRQASTAMMAENFYKHNPNILYPEVSWSGPGPSYNGREFQTITYISALLYRVFGQHDWVGRLIAVVFGVWGVFALYNLVRRVWDEKHALAVAGVMAVMPLSVFVERSFIPDPVMVSLVTTFLWMFVAYLQTDKKIYLLLTAIIGCLGFLTKLPGMLVGLSAVYTMIAILQRRKNLTAKRVWLITGVSIAIMAPVATYYLWARYLSVTYPPYHFAGEGNWLWNDGLISWSKQQYFIPVTQWLSGEWMWGAPVVCLFLIGLFFPPPHLKSGNTVNGRTKMFKAPWLFHFWLAGFVFFYCIGAKELVDNFWNFHIVSPVVAAFSGRAIVLFAIWPKGKLLMKFLRVAFIIAAMLYSSFDVLPNLYTSQMSNPDYKLGMALAKAKKKGDLVVTITQELGNPVAIYYSQCRGWLFPPPVIGTKKYSLYEFPESDATSIKVLEDLRSNGANWFGIVKEQFNTINSKHPGFVNYLNDHYQVYEQTGDYVIFKL